MKIDSTLVKRAIKNCSLDNVLLDLEVEELTNALLLEISKANEEPCSAIKTTGWGTARRCIFKGPHTQHSWVNDL